MSTYWNETTGRYENFEFAVISKMKSVADKLEEAAGEKIEVVAGIRYDTDEQGLTSAEQANARTNIGAISETELASELGDMKTEIDADVEAVSDEASSLKSAFGELDDLQTPVKTDLVSAINSLVGSGDGLTETLKTLLLELFQAAVYTSDKSATIAALETALAIISWSQSGSTLTFVNVPEITSITQDSFTLTLI